VCFRSGLPEGPRKVKTPFLENPPLPGGVFWKTAQISDGTRCCTVKAWTAVVAHLHVHLDEPARLAQGAGALAVTPKSRSNCRSGVAWPPCQELGDITTTCSSIRATLQSSSRVVSAATAVSAQHVKPIQAFQEAAPWLRCFQEAGLLPA
jgi:hypothetical protein